MKSGALRRGIGLVFLYCGVFVLLVIAQFSKGPGFSERIGGLSVHATYPRATQDQATLPERVRISYAGLAIELSSKTPAVAVASGGSTRGLVPESVAKIENGVSVRLSAGFELRAIVDDGPVERFSLSVALPAGSSVSAVRLPLTSRSAIPYASNGKLVLSAQRSTFDVTLRSASVERDVGRLVLRAEGPGLGSMAIARAAAPAARQAPKAEKLAERAPKDAAAFSSVVAPWRDKAWATLSSTRLDAEAVAWETADGSSSFSEKALAAYFSEALSRGVFADAFELGKAAKKKWPDKLSYLTAPFLGGLIPKMQALESSDAAELRRLAQMTADASPALCEREGVLRFMLDRASPKVASDFLAVLGALDPAKLSLRQSVGLLGCVVDAGELLGASDNPLAGLGSVADRLVSAVRSAPEGFFLGAEEDGSCDLKLSALAGRYLADYGAQAGKPALVGVGQGLLEGAMGVSDERGFAPARLMVRNGAVEQRMGALGPEELYPIIAENPYYPHEVSFYREAGPGVWAWTCSPSVTVRGVEAGSVFTARFPEGSAHYLTLYGIEAFANIQLYGIDYNADREFEIYNASGYVYEGGRRALYLKMKHKRENEDIRLSS